MNGYLPPIEPPAAGKLLRIQGSAGVRFADRGPGGELADAAGLKTAVPRGRVGSSPTPGMFVRETSHVAAVSAAPLVFAPTNASKGHGRHHGSHRRPRSTALRSSTCGDARWCLFATADPRAALRPLRRATKVRAQPRRGTRQLCAGARARDAACVGPARADSPADSAAASGGSGDGGVARASGEAVEHRVGEAASPGRRARPSSRRGRARAPTPRRVPRRSRVGVPSPSARRSRRGRSPSVTRYWRSGASPSASTISSTVPSSAGRRLEQAGREAEDRADVDVLAGTRRAPRPVVAPARERAEHRHQLARALGQLVVDARRHLAVALARQQAVGDHAVQPRAQLLGRDAGQHPLQLDEPARAGGEVTDDQQRPLVAHEVERAGVRRPLVVRVTLGGWDGWDGSPPCAAGGDWAEASIPRSCDICSGPECGASSRTRVVVCCRRGRRRSPLGTSRPRMGMGELIDLAQRSARRAAPDTERRAGARASCSSTSRCPFTYLAAERVERAFDARRRGRRRREHAARALARRRLGDGRARARRGRARAPRCGCRSCGPSASPMAVPARDARRGTRGRAGPRRRVRARGGAARVLRRLRPRRPRDPGRGGGGRRPPARRRACARRATRGATARWRRRAAACWRRAPTGCPRCASGARCSGARSACGAAAAAAAGVPGVARALEAPTG